MPVETGAAGAGVVGVKLIELLCPLTEANANTTSSKLKKVWSCQVAPL
jgi:hypothetical protein